MNVYQFNCHLSYHFDTGSVLELEVNWLIQNVNELEFELSRINVDETTR